METNNIAIIFAGGSGRRMNVGAKPKQFLELHGKPIIVNTLELFQQHTQINAIYVACIKEWMAEMQQLCQLYGLSKVRAIVEGGETGQDSIYNGLQAAVADGCDASQTIALIHDGVRPLIHAETITDNIQTARERGACITCVPATETFVVKQTDGSLSIPRRENSLVARAPQTFRLDHILDAHERARRDGVHTFIDSLTMMTHYGYSVDTIIGPSENIKITTPTDYFIFKAIVEARENSQIL